MPNEKFYHSQNSYIKVTFIENSFKSKMNAKNKQLVHKHRVLVGHWNEG
jgi:hypothetical protein